VTNLRDAATSQAYGHYPLPPHGRVAFVTTPRFRTLYPAIVENFICRWLYSLCQAFEVLTTGGSYEFITAILNKPLSQISLARRAMIEADRGTSLKTDHDLELWKDSIIPRLIKYRRNVHGMIEITHELVEGRLDAVIHFTESDDIAAKPDTAVLSREANVHNVPIACDNDTAAVFVQQWNAQLQTLPSERRLFATRARPNITLPLEKLRAARSVLAMIAHDAKKLEMCCFAVQHAKTIFNTFDCILATGTTGEWLTNFMEATGRGRADIDKIHRCLSGPDGGDVQIANAIVQGLCHRVIFLQDPLISHPHDADIRLFQQAVLASERRLELAQNLASARLLLTHAASLP
jgi:methylglyoxal synthase